MTPETLAQLGVLALVDSTSIGTLVIPVWLLMRRDAGRTLGKVATYLAAVGVFYFLVGLLLLSGAAGLGNMLGGGVGTLLELPAVQVVMVAAGAGMLIWSFKDTSIKDAGRKPGGDSVTSPGQPPSGVPSGAQPGIGGQDSTSPAGDSSTNGGGSTVSPRAAAAQRRSQAAEHRWQHRIGRALTSRAGLLGLALLAAIAIVYVIMVATFKSLIQPLILLVSVPFAATGAILLLLVTGVPLGLPSLVGMLMLVGIVVTNAIVLVDLINQYRRPHDGRPGMNVADAIMRGARQRLRPILMTALATVFALTPMALGVTGEGGFISRPLAIVVIGGLVSSTVLTLILVPVLYRLVEGSREKRAGRRRHAADRTPAGTGAARV